MQKQWKKLKIQSDSAEFKSDQQKDKEDIGGKDRCHVLVMELTVLIPLQSLSARPL